MIKVRYKQVGNITGKTKDKVFISHNRHKNLIAVVNLAVKNWGVSETADQARFAGEVHFLKFPILFFTAAKKLPNLRPILYFLLRSCEIKTLSFKNRSNFNLTELEEKM